MIIILMAIAMVGLIGAGSLAIDIGSALVTKAELQNVADASSLAATRELAMVYRDRLSSNGNKDVGTYALTGDDIKRIQDKAVAFAAANKAGGLSIVVEKTADVQPCVWNDAKKAYDKCGWDVEGPRAVRVTGRRDDVQNGQVQTVLGRVLGINQIAIDATAASAITAAGTLKYGKGEFPIGLDEDWFSSHTCASNETVVMYPTSPGSCAGWHTFNTKPASASRLKEIVEGIGNGSFKSPETIAGETRYEFVGGTINPILEALEGVFDAKKTGGSWLVNVPVYQSSGCANPNQDRLIVGFAKMRITKVKKQPNGRVEGDVECGIFTDEETAVGNGPKDFGTLVGVPGMVQ